MKTSQISLIVLAALSFVLNCRASANADSPDKPSIKIQLQSTFSTGNDELGAPGGLPLTDGDLRVPFAVTVPLRKKLTFIFVHTNINETLGRVTNANGSYMYPGAYNGDANDGSLAYKTGTMTWNLGYLQRHRACCPYDAVQEHLVYVGFEGDFGPVVNKTSLFVFTLQGLRTTNHQKAAAFLAANAPGYTYADYKGNLAIYRTSIEMRLPVGKHGLRILAITGIDSDYFDYEPIPLYYDYANFGIEKAVTPNLTFTMLVENLTGREQGYPFVYPNAIHRAKVVLNADYKIPF